MSRSRPDAAAARDEQESLQLFSADREAIFLDRPNRFTVLCRLREEGRPVRAHSANPGRMLELLQPGTEILLSSSPDPKRKTPFTMVAVRRPRDNRVIPLVSVAANRLASELILPRLFPEARLRREVTRGGSRFDFLVESDGKQTWVEVKSCTLEAHGVAMFPDAATDRGRRHVEELTEITGANRLVLFVLQGVGADRFVPDIHTDPRFAVALRNGADAGVEVRAAAVSCDETGRATVERFEVPVDFEPVSAVDSDTGSYILQLRLDEPREITAGKLGNRRFEAGHYLYVGSAMGGLSARTRRHLQRRKRFHWHIDFLRDVASAAWAYPIYSHSRLECETAAALRELYSEPIGGFGSSDCGCRSHLFYSREDPRKAAPFVELILYYRHHRSLSRP